ncbi:protein of unknown function [Methylorubrum extorquens]|uniref:Uncharacterized protein n=1 Tax=Methylorubrum extorquens TaxID=408 RepID=A0A2N9AY45_METEX|nr:protein of unknown function [Methylorubrum extorquens]
MARQACAGMGARGQVHERGAEEASAEALNRDSRSLPSPVAWLGVESGAAVARAWC